jgi:hypothetical protein
VDFSGMRRSPFSASLWFLAAAASLPLGGCGMTTYGTGQVPEMALFREMSGGILSKNEKKKEPIEYQPRAPLVMPPSAETATAEQQLPEPMETASAASPDWPMDPSERIGASTEYDGNNPAAGQAEYRRLRPLAGVFSNQGGRPTYELDESGKTEYYSNIVHDRRQREEFKQALAESKGYGRTERRYLTDPPMAYRDPVPTAPGEEPVVPKKKKNFLSRWFSGG